MTETAKLTDALKKNLKARGVTYAALASRLNLSEASVKSWLSSSSFTLRRLEQICGILELSVYELAKLAGNQTETVTRLTFEREAAIASNARLFLVFVLLLNQWDADEIVEQYSLTKPEVIKLITGNEWFDY